MSKHAADPTAADQIRLVLPAEPGYGRLARIAASTLAMRLGIPFDEIDDLRIALDETVILLLRPDGVGGSGGELTVEFTIEPEALVIDVSSSGSDEPPIFEAEAVSRFEQLVRDTVDEHRVDLQLARVRLVKRY